MLLITQPWPIRLLQSVLMPEAAKDVLILETREIVMHFSLFHESAIWLYVLVVFSPVLVIDDKYCLIAHQFDHCRWCQSVKLMHGT